MSSRSESHPCCITPHRRAFLSGSISHARFSPLYHLVDHHHEAWWITFYCSTASVPALGTTFYLLGKFGATAAFGTTYLYTSELFPTGWGKGKWYFAFFWFAGSATHVWAWALCVAGLGPSYLPMWQGIWIFVNKINQTFPQLGAFDWTPMASNGCVRLPSHSFRASHTSPSWNSWTAFARLNATTLLWSGLVKSPIHHVHVRDNARGREDGKTTNRASC